MSQSSEIEHTPPEMLSVVLLLTRLYAHDHTVALCWRRHFTGGPVLEDIAGRIITSDGPSANVGYACWCVACGHYLVSTSGRLRGRHFDCDAEAGVNASLPSCDHAGLREAETGIGALVCGDCGLFVGRRRS